MSLTERQKRFVRAYRETGNATESARRAGYNGDNATLRVTASRLLANANVSTALATLDAKAEKKSIATVEELFEFWSSVLRDENLELRDRLKASELRAKAAGAFIEKREVSGPGGSAIKSEVRVDAVDGLEGEKLMAAARALLKEEPK